MNKKYYEVTVRAIISCNDPDITSDNLESLCALSFFVSDSLNDNEFFLPATDKLTVVEYLDTYAIETI